MPDDRMRAAVPESVSRMGPVFDGTEMPVRPAVAEHDPGLHQALIAMIALNVVNRMLTTVPVLER